MTQKACSYRQNEREEKQGSGGLPPENFYGAHPLEQGSQAQFTRVPLEAVCGCGWAAIGIPQKSSKVFSSAHISMKWLLMSRNRGVHETSVSWPSSDKGHV